MTIKFVAQPVQRVGYGLDNKDSVPDRGSDGIFSLHHHVQTGSGAHSTFYSMDTEGSYPRGIVARA